jgi:YVTN family beta-propeller protein
MNRSPVSPIAIFILFLIIVFASQPADAQKSLESIFIINEGAFFQGNASVTKYNAMTEEVSQNVFSSVNGRPLGDVANSASVIGDFLYIVVNNSHTVEVTNKNDLSSVATIEIDDTNGGSPRHILQIDENRAFVTNLYDNTISVIHLSTHTVEHTISVIGNPEGMAMSSGKVFAALSGFGNGNSVAVIDPATLEVTSTIQVGDNPRVIRADANGAIWVMCTGNYGYDNDFNPDPALETLGEIHVIDAADETLIRVIDTGGHPDDMYLFEPENALYVLNNGIQKIDTRNFETEEEMVVDRYLYSFGIIGGDEPRLIGGVASDDFQSAGYAVLYSMDGAPIDSFATGIGPGDFVMMYSVNPVSMADRIGVPEAFLMHPNYPNPFNPSTVIPFDLRSDTHVRVSVYDISGRLVSHVADQRYNAGRHNVTFHAAGISSGVYIVRMQTSAGVQTAKMVLIR